MKRLCLALAAVFLVTGLLAPPRCPAPLIWRRGEGWSYERQGITTGRDPKEQLDLGKDWQAKGEYRNAINCYRRVIIKWPTSFAVEDARLGLAECLSAIGYHWQAFKEYQNLIEKHPNCTHFDMVLQREYEIGNLFFAGERHKQWGVRWLPSLDKAIDIYQQVVKNGPYSKVGPEAQFRIGLTYEKEKEFTSAVHAYEKIIERYGQDPIAERAQFQIGYAYQQESKHSEYDQNAANQALDAYADFLVRYPHSERAAHAEEARTLLSVEQARGLFQIGQFYEKQKKYKAALIYYNDVIEKNPKSQWGAAAKDKVALLTPRVTEKTATP